MRNTFIRNEITSREVILVYANVLYKEKLRRYQEKQKETLLSRFKMLLKSITTN